MATSNPTTGPTPNASIRVLTDKDGNMISPVTSFDSVFTSTGGGIKEALLDYIYPVGSIYMSANNVNPGTFLGGTWTQITDKFLLAAGSKYTAGSVGGSATKTISTANLPNYTLYSASHTHTQAAHNHGIPGYNQANGSGSGISKEDATSTVNNNWAYSTTSATPTINGTTITVTSGGSGTAMDIMPPYEVVYTWKRTA